MSFWLIFWLGLFASVPIIWYAALKFEEWSDSDYSGLMVFLIAVFLCFQFLIGALGIIAWVIIHLAG